MRGRKQEINLHLSQILDSCLLVLAFYVSHLIASTVRLSVGWEGWLGGGEIPAFKEFFWLMAIIVPFTPIVLEFYGYYDSPLIKSRWRTIRQLARALVIIGVIIGGCVVFFKWGAQSRMVLLLLAVIGGGLLLLKESLIRSYLKRRALVEGIRERVIFAAEPEEIGAMIEGMSAEMMAEIEVAAEIDPSSESVTVNVEGVRPVPKANEKSWVCPGCGIAIEDEEKSALCSQCVSRGRADSWRETCPMCGFNPCIKEMSCLSVSKPEASMREF